MSPESKETPAKIAKLSQDQVKEILPHVIRMLAAHAELFEAMSTSVRESPSPRLSVSDVNSILNTLCNCKVISDLVGGGLGSILTSIFGG
jgi:hypothetical protein